MEVKQGEKFSPFFLAFLPDENVNTNSHIFSMCNFYSFIFF
jgi:hypothetical protein